PPPGLIPRPERSVLFVLPWGRHWIIGTTDTDWALDKSHPAASSRDIDYLLENVNSVVRSPLRRTRVRSRRDGARCCRASRSRRPSSPGSTWSVILSPAWWWWPAESTPPTA